MKVTRVRIQDFRGYESADIFASGHVVIAGEPRGGRTDLVTALRRVLDPKSTASRVDPLDIRRNSDVQQGGPLTEVEVTLTDLGIELEQLLDDQLEAIDPETGEVALADPEDHAILGVRLCYRAWYDDDSDSGDHWVDWPAHSRPDDGYFARARRVEREAIPFLYLQPGAALQVRAEGAFRRLLDDADPDGLQAALEDLEGAIGNATSDFASSDTISTGVEGILDAGAGQVLGTDDPAAVSFAPEDGSLAGLLRALQPALDLDSAGPLPLTSHGSSARSVVSVAEAVAAARADDPGLVIAIDDFGDSLDGGAAEYLTVELRRAASQVWVTTRRADVLRAFDPEELLRLTRSHGDREVHRLTPTTDRKTRRARRELLPQLFSAMTARTVALVEGPHDIEGYGALSARKARRSSGSQYLLSAHSVRLVSASGEGGGKDVLPQLASLAADFGFHVRVVVDEDKPGASDKLLDELESKSELLVVLPARTSIEGALTKGLSTTALRTALTEIVEDHGIDLDVDDLDDTELPDVIKKRKVLKAKGGLHQPWVEALPKNVYPPLGLAVLRELCSDKTGRSTLDDPA